MVPRYSMRYHNVSLSYEDRIYVSVKDMCMILLSHFLRQCRNHANYFTSCTVQTLYHRADIWLFFVSSNIHYLPPRCCVTHKPLGPRDLAKMWRNIIYWLFKYARRTFNACVSSPNSVTTAHEHLTTLLALPSSSILHKPTYSPSSN